MIFNLLSDDIFLSLSISTILRDIGNFKFIATSTSKIPVEIEEHEHEVIYLIDGRVTGGDVTPWLVHDVNHHIAFLSFSHKESIRWRHIGRVFDISGSVWAARRTIQNILSATLGASNRDGDVITFPALTKRETDVFVLLIRGWSVYEIAEHLHCSPKTIYAHRNNIAKKKGARRFYHLHKEVNNRMFA